MDTNNFQSSFIPKKPLTGGTSRTPARHHSWFALIATTLLIIVIFLAGGVFAWKILTQKKIKSLEAETEAAQATFDPALLDQLERLDDRIETAKKLLNEHLAFSSFFDALASITLKNVSFSSFGYTQTGSKVNVVMNGEAESFSTLALQADSFGAASHVLSNPVISGVSLQKNGHVLFSVSFTVNPALISYRKNVVIVPEATSTQATSTRPGAMGSTTTASTTVTRQATSTQ